MFGVFVAGALNSLFFSLFILLTYFRGYEYFFNNIIPFTENDVYLSLYFSVALTAAIALIFSTRFSDLIFNRLMCNRKLIKREQERLEPLLVEVHNQVIEKFKFKKIKVKLKIKDDKVHNLAAVGVYTVAINRSIYEHYDDETLKGVIAHELGHIYNRDSVNTGIIYVLISLSSLFILICSFIMITGFMFSRCLRGMMFLLVPFIMVIVCCAAIVFGILMGTFFFFNIFLKYCYRQNEFRADKFACNLGYGKVLINFFEKTKEADYEIKGLKGHLFSTHPKNIIRIGRLEEFLKEEQVYNPIV